MARAHLAGVTLLACLTVGGCAEDPIEPAVAKPGGFNCVVAGGAGVEHCTRISEDIARRATLDDTERRRAQEVADDVQVLVSRLGGCPVTEATCAKSVTRPPNADDAAQLTRELAAKGLTATARIAATDDPAPAGALLYAVDVEAQACAVGYIAAIPDGGAGYYVAGRLPDGRCLVP